MATTIVIACPKCDKQMKAPDTVLGKKIRCKGCEEVFTAIAPVSAKAATKDPAPAAKAAPAPAPQPEEIEDEEENDFDAAGKRKVFGVIIDDSDLPRCPFCATEMEAVDAIVCLNCGYNTRTRARAQVEAVHGNTGGQVFAWLLPGIACLLGAILLLTIDVIAIVKMPIWLEGSFLQNDDKTWLLKPGAFSLYLSLASMGLVLPMGMFAFKRLIQNPKPPEKQIKT